MPVRVHVRPPNLWNRDERLVPIPYARHAPELCPILPSPIDRHVGAAIAFLIIARGLAEAFLKIREDARDYDSITIDPLLAVHFNENVWSLRRSRQQVREALAALVAVGQKALDPILRAHCATLPPPPAPRDDYDTNRIRAIQRRDGLLRFASDPSIDPPLFVSEPDLWADIFPLQTPRAWRMDGLFQTDPDLLVSEWRTMKTTQQVVLPDPRPIESVLHLLTCATIAADEALMDVDLAAKKFGTSALSPALATQLHATSEYSGYLLNRVDSALEDTVKVGRAQRDALEKVQAERLVQLEDRIVVLGDRERPQNYFIIGAC